jgi:hypothetical protein
MRGEARKETQPERTRQHPRSGKQRYIGSQGELQQCRQEMRTVVTGSNTEK